MIRCEGSTFIWDKSIGKIIMQILIMIVQNDLQPEGTNH